MSGKPSTAWLEGLLVAAAIFCFGWLAGVYGYGWYFRSQQVSAFNELVGDLRGKKPTLPDIAPPASVPMASADIEDRNLVGIIDVPRLGISTPVISGDDERALEVAAGHLADTPMPWEHGNSAIAAHRDTLFRPLEHVKVGDELRMRTTRGDFAYRVKSTKIVDPDDVSVLSSAGADALTLITCYPFRFVGHAPQRFIVRAERVGPLPDTTDVRRVSYRSLRGNRPAPSLSPQPAASAASDADAAADASLDKRPPAKPTSAVKAKVPAARSSARPRAGSAQQTKAVPKSRTSAGVKAEASGERSKKKADDEPKKKRRWYHIFIGDR